MTVARVNRARQRFILGIVALVIVIGFVAIFQNNQQENDELRQIGIRCEQQLGAMESTKARMQNMIDAEQLEKEGCREKMKNVEDKMRENSKSLESAKQSKSITETHLGDCKNEKDQLSSDNKKLKEEIKSLKLEKTRKIEALESKLAAAESKARDSNVMTAECTQLQDENDRIRKELDIYRDKYYSRQYSSSIDPVRKAVPSVSQSFNQQVPAIQQGIPNPQRAQEEKSVLALPGMQKSSSTTTTTTESSKAEKRNDNLKAPPMIQSPTDKLSSAVSTKKQLPNGVVPIPESSLLDGNGAALDEQIEQNLKDVKIDLLNANEQENLGHEMQDGDLNIDNNNDKKSHADNNNMGIENNAEEDTNNYLNDNRQIFGNIGKDSDHSNKLKDDKQLNNEIQDDLGKEGENYADIRLDGQADEDGDIGEYDDLKAMKVQGPAERN